jgi:hypothetical protein
MILTATIASVLYIFGLGIRHTVVTPDGGYYLAMGRGAHVPRPYSLRGLAGLLPNIMSWRVLHMVSYMVLALTSHVFAERHGVDGTAVAIAVLCLPTIRQSIAWPVLLDVPMLAYIGCAAVFGSESMLVGMFMIGIAPVIHERAALWCAVYLAGSMHWFLILIALVLAGITYAHFYLSTQPHPDETAVEWLRHPIKAAVAKHRATLETWQVWVLPWGASVIGLFWDNAQLYAAMLLGYAGCIAAQDRARIIAPAALLLCTGAVIVAGDYAIAIPIVNYFTHNREV